MKSTKIVVKTPSKSYPIYFGDKIINLTGSIIQKNLPGVKKICIIVDRNIPSKILKELNLSLKKYKIKIYKLASFEKTKEFNTANKMVESLIKENFNRSDCIIALGGGIIGDFSSFVASITKRGLKFINIPTTLLAQADSSIGGKTGVNSSQGKNLIGTFYQPDFVLSDTSVLKSLPKREVICGYAEILKHALIDDRKFFFWLCKNAKKIISLEEDNILKLAIMKSCKIKTKIVNKDEKEKNIRMTLNFGHTFAHGFEGAKKFSKKLNHGEAVLLGMMMASKLALKKKILSTKEFVLIREHYLDLNLPRDFKKKFKKKDINKIINFVKKDKKNLNERINLIFINKIGSVTRPGKYNISKNEFRKFLISQQK